MKTASENEKWNDIYQYVLSVYMGKMSMKDAAERVHDLYNNVATGSFRMYYDAYKKMLLGELYTMDISSSLHIVFLENIDKNYGKEGLRTALKAFFAHIEYRKKNGNNPVTAKKIYEEYAQKII